MMKSAHLLAVCLGACLLSVPVTASALPAPAVGGASPWPYDYNWTTFPAAWFGANDTDWESDAQLQAIGKYSMAILGWQHLDNLMKWVDVVYIQLAQAALIKKHNPKQPVYIYTSFGWAFGMNGPVFDLMDAINKGDRTYADFFLQSGSGFEFSQTNCQQAHTSPGATGGRCVGWFWNMANASARDYFIEKLVEPLAKSPMIDGVFYDAFNYGYDIPEVRPWGRQVTNIPNCSVNDTWTGCEALVQGSLLLAKRIADTLNANGKIPMFANPGTFVRPVSRGKPQKIWLDEKRLVSALQGTQWQLYYEGARGDSALSAGTLSNMMEEDRLGVAAGVHTYLKTNATTHTVESQLVHMAAFLLAREDNWYYFGSTGWWDNSFTWNTLYDDAAACGKPLGSATANAAGLVWTRAFTGCKVTLTCHNKTLPDCTGDISYA